MIPTQMRRIFNPLQTQLRSSLRQFGRKSLKIVSHGMQIEAFFVASLVFCINHAKLDPHYRTSLVGATL